MTAALIEESIENGVILSHGIMTIGRGKINKMSLALPTVSHQHAKIVTFNQAAYIQDLESTNGTYVNNKKITYHRLHIGDHVQVGEYTFIIVEIK